MSEVRFAKAATSTKTLCNFNTYWNTSMTVECTYKETIIFV